MHQFLRELKRRRLLHTASLYVVGAWVALQVVEVLSGAGLPPSTMRNLLVMLSVGFPFALVIGWFFDISKEGISRTGPLDEDEQLPHLKFIDYVLLCGLAIVVIVDAYILSFPPPPDTQVTAGETNQQQTIAVLSFTDSELATGSDPVGDVVATDLRSALSRVKGLHVLGPETSKALSSAGTTQMGMATELNVNALLLGEVLLGQNQIQITTRLVAIPTGDDLWSGTIRGLLGEAGDLQQGLIRQIVGTIAPNINLDPGEDIPLGSGNCEGVYDLYLRGKQLSQKRRVAEAGMRNRGVELLREAVFINEQCAVAWEALAVEANGWQTVAGFVKAGAAARRALKINEALPEAWTVLAEIAEVDQRWTESEEFFLRALYADANNAYANIYYAEALLVRGRIKDALHYAFEAYRSDPASSYINFMISIIGKSMADADLTIKHAIIAIDLLGERHPYYLDQLAEGYLIKGDTQKALAIYAEMGDLVVDWFPECVSYRGQPDYYPALATRVEETLERFRSGEYDEELGLWYTWQAVRCGTWIGATESIVDLLIEHDWLPHQRFLATFIRDAKNLRQHPRFHELVRESELLDYWRQWGWADYCKPDGDSFSCD